MNMKRPYRYDLCWYGCHSVDYGNIQDASIMVAEWNVGCEGAATVTRQHSHPARNA